MEALRFIREIEVYAMLLLIVPYYFIFQGSGIIFILALFFMFILPSYAALRMFFEKIESFIISPFAGLGYYAFSVWYLGYIMPLSSAALTSALLLYSFPFILEYARKKKGSEK